ncbi:MAG: hypothetical protein HOM27_01680 [Candidatus Marinimicrobia bacterium]|jgi:hypothetical protein|nr:hypothetical protein [Candidatus Neomarinimicrobiota bacterium]MBT5114763.1 hypothetical protein [Candidatus Neomarinimicrobiota bacterium]MBT5749022.1 hypothetical protein [Candidatus Neomarinimicrobiota bacterium]MBT6796282.1 hypothetical protein [Candidatus Neomarinimicrobiota bacterium]
MNFNNNAISIGMKWSAGISLIQVKRLLRHAFLVLILFISSCVSPPEYQDGLLENIPAIVDEVDYFSLSILGDDYTVEKDWDITLITDSSDTILTTLVLADMNISSQDSSYLFMMNDSGDTIFRQILVSEVVWSAEIEVPLIGPPKKISFLGDNFTGRLEFQILKK